MKPFASDDPAKVIEVNFNDEKENIKDDQQPKNQEQHSAFTRIGSALIFCSTSVLMTLINKQCLTVYNFPSPAILGLAQMITTVLILSLAKVLDLITFPDFKISTFSYLMPLPAFYIINVMVGLGSTKALPLPMFSTMRRLTVVLTLIGEVLVLKKWPSKTAIVAVLMMILGSFMAASADLSFDLTGYCQVIINNFSSTGIMVYTKKKINKTMGMENNAYSYKPQIA